VAFRVLHLHDAESNVLEMLQLTIDGAHASFKLGSKEGGEPANGGPLCTTTASGAEQCRLATTMDSWQRETHATMTGTAQRRDTGIELDFQRPDSRQRHLGMRCTEQWLEVAPANAMVILPDCAWSAATERTKVLGCLSLGETTPFAPSPGIEQVDPDHESTECAGRPDVSTRAGRWFRCPGAGAVTSGRR
jgi:hypothetical protein